MRWVGYVGSYVRREVRNAYMILMEKLEGKGPLGKPRSRRRIILEKPQTTRMGGRGLDSRGSG